MCEAFMLLKKVSQYYQIISNLSIDVVLGVITNALAVQVSFKSPFSVWWLLGLAVGTWFIYLFDHVLDNFRKPQSVLSTRHNLIKKMGGWAWFLLATLLLMLVLCAYLSSDTLLLISGIAVGVVTLAHLIMAVFNPQRKHLFNNKEIGVALVYALSVYVYPVLCLARTPQMEPLLYGFIILLLITYQSLLLCSIVDYRIDQVNSSSSFVQVIGLVRSQLVYIGLSLAILLVGWMCYITPTGINPSLLGTYVLMSLGHIGLYALYQRRKNYPYRQLAELLFWLPLLFVIIQCGVSH